MLSITVLLPTEQRKFNCIPGVNLLELLRRQNILVSSVCGGKGVCRKCKVWIDDQEVLACQTTVEYNMVIRITDQMLVKQTVPNSEIAQSASILAMDLGTTTVVLYFLDGKTFEIKHTSVFANPQITYGADIMSRIQAANEGKLLVLQNSIVRRINQEILAVVGEHTIQKLMIAGNTTMLHLLAKIHPGTMGKAPYTPVFLEEKHFKGGDLGLLAKDVVFMPSISSFIGADAVSGCLWVKLPTQPGNVLYIDMGTNGEMILKKGDTYYVTSAAAGPAFEGGEIELGMAGVPGAVRRAVYKKGEWMFETIEEEATGFCGSGLIDILAIMVKEGMIEESGAFRNGEHDASSGLFNGKYYLQNQLYITQQDVRMFQVAKSAIVTAMELLINQAQLTAKDITRVYVAGSFGANINIEHSIEIGLFPEAFRNKIQIVGNASGLGAVEYVKSQDMGKWMETMKANVRLVDLQNDSAFQTKFVDHMFFKKIVK